MAKGDDAVAKKKNKARRKKLRSENANVSARVASIIAAKKRRLSGKRRQCQGMCFSLPTPDDPFNDRHAGKDLKDFKRKDTKKNVSFQGNDIMLVQRKTRETVSRNEPEIDNLEQKREKVMKFIGDLKKSLGAANNSNLELNLKKSLGAANNSNLELNSRVELKNKKVQLNGEAERHDHQRSACEYTDGPSKFLILCLKVIEKALRDEGIYSEEDKPLFINSWGIELWKHYSIGKDAFEASGSSCTIEQIAWMVSVAADSIARKEKEGLSYTSPFLLFLVPSQEKAAQVRMVCKPLKALGIHTVSLHPGASLDHQVKGLKSCEPEFLVSTPGRLLELVSLKALDVSGVSFLVVDEVDSFNKNGCLEALTSITKSISGHPHIMIFNDPAGNTCISGLQDLSGSVCSLSDDGTTTVKEPTISRP